VLFFSRRSAAELPRRKTDATAASHAAGTLHTTAAKHTTSTQTYTAGETVIMGGRTNSKFEYRNAKQ
jgi:hypothetical protein